MSANRPSEPQDASQAIVMPAWVDDAMLAEFFDAQRFGLAEVEEILLGGATGDADRARLARILHTLKGESGTVGLVGFEELYHAIEDFIAPKADLRPVMDDLFAVKDWLLDACAALTASRPAPEGRAYLLERLRGGGPLPLPAPSEPGTESFDPESAALFGEFYDEAQDLVVTIDDYLHGLEAGARDSDALTALQRAFKMIATQAGFLDLGTLKTLAVAAQDALDGPIADPERLDPTRVAALVQAATRVRRLLDTTRDAFAGRPVTPLPADDSLLEALRGGGAAPTPASNTPPPPEASEGDAAESSTSARVRETIKVDLLRVDELVETIGELVIVEAMVAHDPAFAQISSRTRDRLAMLSKIVRDLQRQGLALRMVPLRGVFQKMSRLVRDLSKRFNKPIRLELSGQDAEMDRSLAESLGDPLVHMMRNAIDHGIEPIEARRAAGKPEIATIHLRAFHESGNIIIELADDGRGLDRDAILAKAIAKGLVPPDADLTDREIYDLIFAPGFSTAEKVTEMSGRGVGMDVVRKTVEGLRGRIHIQTERGRGTTFRMVLPLTLAIIEGMLLVSGPRRYVLPTLAITETLQPERSQVHRFGQRHTVLDVRGSRLPLVDLAALLGVDSRASRDPSQGFVMVVDGLNSRFALLVDELLGQQQVVIKTIDPSINAAGLFSGAAILSDGTVGLILNPTALGSETSFRGA